MNPRVLITGGASGIGKAIAQKLVSANVNVLLWDRCGPSLDQTCRELGPLSTCQVVDIALPSSIKVPMETPVTHLVNNAAILGDAMHWDAIDPEKVREILDVNIVGLMMVTSAFLKQSIPLRNSAIVNLASIAGDNGGAPGFATYGASKGAVIALTRAMSRDFAPNIRVNAVAPGVIDTKIQDKILTSPEARELVEKSIPLQRLGGASEVAEAVHWLLFDATYTTGETITISGGKR